MEDFSASRNLASIYYIGTRFQTFSRLYFKNAPAWIEDWDNIFQEFSAYFFFFFFFETFPELCVL